MEIMNLYAAWLGILLGFIAGAIIGLFFQNDNWLGGYSSWERRMLRLGHISFFGIAFINLAYSLSIRVYEINVNSSYPSILFIVGAITMPTVCFLSAYKKHFRHLFPIPVISLLIGTIIFCAGGISL